MENSVLSEIEKKSLMESEQFLKLLPKEIWDYICSFLDSKDFHSVINSSPFFRELLLQKRVHLLLQPVMKTLLQKFQKLGITFFVNGRVPYTPYHDPLAFLTSTRLICKQYKNTIDNMASLWNEDGDKNTVHNHFSKNYKFVQQSSTSRTLDNFIDNFKNTHPPDVNPFPGKYISLCYSANPLNEAEVSPKFLEILEKYGKHLSSCDINFHFGIWNLPEHHHKVMEWLCCMPNLQNLKIHYEIYSLSNDIPQAPLQCLPPNLKLLKNLIIKTKWPPLDESRNPNDISNEDIPDWSWLELYNLSQLIEAQENVESLKIMLFNKADLKVFGSIILPLKTIVVHCYCKEDNLELSEVLNILSEKFSKRLEDLMIRFHVRHELCGNLKVMRDSFYERLNLQNVKKLEIEVLNVCFLDFALGMQANLEELVIRFVGRREGKDEYGDLSNVEKIEVELMKSEQIVQFLGYENKLLESNIWSLFPKLRKVDLFVIDKHVEYLRKDWVKKHKVRP